MRIKLNQVFTNLLKAGVTAKRTSNNCIAISKSNGDINFDILLPTDFELDSNALGQLLNFAHYKTPTGKAVKCACATPDFHAGANIPVGAVVVTHHDVVIPGAVGTDINCGMRLHSTGLNLA